MGHCNTGKCGGKSGACDCRCDGCFKHYAHDLWTRDTDIRQRDARISELTAEVANVRMHAKAIAAAADGMRAHEKAQDEIVRDLQRQLDEARALVEAAARFEFGPVTVEVDLGNKWTVINETPPFRTTPIISCYHTRDEAIAKARALAAKESGR